LCDRLYGLYVLNVILVAATLTVVALTLVLVLR